MRRGRLIAGAALAVGALLLARWLMSPDDVAPTGADAVAPLSTKHELTRAAPESPAQLPLVASAGNSGVGIVAGQIIDAATGAPVREFELQVHDPRPGAASNDAARRRAFRTSDGRFEWRGPPPGAWLLTVTARNYQRFELPDLRISPGESTTGLVLPLRAGHRVTGRIYDASSSAAVGGARINFRESHLQPFEGNFRLRPEVTSASDGTFAFDGVPTGRVTLAVTARGYASRDIDVVMDRKTPPLAIGLSGGASISGYLAAADGATPITGQVQLRNLSDETSQMSSTGQAGEFSFLDIAPGTYKLIGQASIGLAEREIVIGDAERVEGVVLAIGPGRSIRGVVTGLRPEQMQHVTVRLQQDGQLITLEPVAVDARGAYELTGVQPGRVDLIANFFTARQVTRRVDMPPDADLTVDLQFKPGSRLTGRVTRQGKPLAGTSLMVRPATPSDVEATPYYNTATSTNGEYSLEGLRDGDYIIVVVVDSYRTRTFQVRGDTWFDIDIPSAQLAGRVLEESGSVPIVGAVVDIRSAETHPSRLFRSRRTDHFGQFALAGLEPGEFVLSVHKPGYEMYRERIAYGAPTTGMAIRLRVAKGVEISAFEARHGKPLRWLLASEGIAGSQGSTFPIRLDENGVGYLPAALEGSTMTFYAAHHQPVVIRRWTGQALELKFERLRNQ